MQGSISFMNGVKNANIPLASSKSISNRVLIIQKLAGDDFRIENLSTSTDTISLVKALKLDSKELNVGDAGTSFRFLVSLLSICKGKWKLTGSERMKERPIGLLVEALKNIGADISYSGIEGFAPLAITGKELEGGNIEIDSSVSSQFISSLMLIGPCLSNGLKIKLKNLIASQSYITMTASMMKHFGVEVILNGSVIEILPKLYQSKYFKVENDWSGASYFYLLCALNPGTEFRLNNLNMSSVQGDSVLSSIMGQFGVHSVQVGENIAISSMDNSPSEFNYNFSSIPDLVMTFAVLCVAKKCKAHFTGVKNLRFKESDRLSVLKSELEKCGAIVEVGEDSLKIHPGALVNPGIINVNNDHRIAMAFAPLASLVGRIQFDEMDVVKKSYPNFWEDLKLLGAEVSQPI